MKKYAAALLLLFVAGLWLTGTPLAAQEEGAEPAAGDIVKGDEAGAPAATTNLGSGEFITVVLKSGPMGRLLWAFLFGAAAAAVYFAVDCAITVRARRIIPQNLVESVTIAMGEGDVLAALKNCESEPGPLANVLTAGFSHVEEGFEVIQEAVTTAADLETENIMQKLTWLSVVGNLAPMLGLLGTVQGMIAAFSTLAEGAPDVGVLAMNISQALYTTAGGLTIAVPCVAFYYIFRNTANKIVLRMEALTLEMIKDLRNVEVIEG